MGAVQHQRTMTVYFTAHADRHVSRYREAAVDLADEFGMNFRILVSTPEPPGHNDDLVVHLGGREGEKERSGQPDPHEAAERLRAHASVVPGDIPHSDLRLAVGGRTLHELADEAGVLANRISSRFSLEPPTVVFTSSGTNVLHSVANALAAAAGARTYRVHEYLNLNLGMQGARVWFCANNHMALSDDPADKFEHEEAAVAAQIEQLHEATIQRVNRLDELSKPLRALRMPTDRRALALDVARVARGALSRESSLQRAGDRARARLRVLRNARRLRPMVTRAADLPGPFVLFAMNAPDDSQILVRAPQYRDFLALVELVAGLMPYGMSFVLREHPAFVGSLDPDRLRDLRRRHPQVVLASSDEPLLEILGRAEAVMIVNNTAFVDATLARKPVIGLGDGYFKGHGIVHEVEYLKDLRGVFARLETGQLRAASREDLARLMRRLYFETWPPPGVTDADKVGVILAGARAKLLRLRACGCLTGPAG